MSVRSWWAHRWGGLLVGTATTLLLCALWITGALERLDLHGQTLLLRHAGTIEADPRILMIDLDDSAFDRVGRWPWNRRHHADLIDTLHELGARAVIMDLVFGEPSTPRADLSYLGPHYDVDPPQVVYGAEEPPVRIFDDDELAAAIGRAANVYLAMYFATDVPPKTRAARGQAEAYLAEHPDGNWPGFRAAALPDEPPDHLSPRRNELILAWRYALARRAIFEKSASLPADLAGLPLQEDWVPPIEKLAAPAAGVGFVSYPRKAVDGTLREVPVLARADGYLLPSLGLLAAYAVEGANVLSARFDAARSTLVVSDKQGGETIVPVTDDGRLLVYWQRPPRQDWRSSFRHLPAEAIMEIPLARRARKENQLRAGWQWARLLQARHAATPASYARYVKLVQQLQSSDETGNQSKSQRQAARDELGAMRQEATEWLDFQQRLYDADPEVQPPAELAALFDAFAPGGLIDRLKEASAKSLVRERALREQLDSVAGRVCFVGYTASAVAEFVPTPVHEAMPGVMAHANVANMVLQHRFLRKSGNLASLLLLLAAGVLTTLLAAVRGSLTAMLSLICVALGCLLTGYVAFGHGVVMPYLSMVTVAAIPFSTVTLFRQFTEEREKRVLRRALSQYTAPAVAARVAERADFRDLAPQPATVTCFFADLKGFTSLSEQLGPEKTREILNDYLLAVSNELITAGAMVNKFIGDGVFAFFNAPILACENHAAAACRAALAALRAIDRLNAAAPELPQALVARIGIATGEVFVGNYGTPAKLDYTCIGDRVNVAARLERANKLLGTKILIDGPTQASLGDAFLYRPLGKVELPGRRERAMAAELLAATAEATETQRRLAAAFEPFARHYTDADWTGCNAILDACLEIEPDDPACRELQSLLAQLARQPVPPGWDGALLTGGYQTLAATKPRGSS